MRVNNETKSMDIEPREINFLVDHYMAGYLMRNNNIMPEVVTFPLYTTAHTQNYGDIPIRFVKMNSQEAWDIVEDGKNVPEATNEEIAELDRREQPTIEHRLAEMQGIGGSPDESVSSEGESATSELVVQSSPIQVEEPVGDIVINIPPTSVLSLDDLEAMATKAELDTPEVEEEAPVYVSDKDAAKQSPAKAALTAVKQGKQRKPATVDQENRVPKQPPGGALPAGTTIDSGAPRRAGTDINATKRAVTGKGGRGEGRDISGDKSLRVSDAEVEAKAKAMIDAGQEAKEPA